MSKNWDASNGALICYASVVSEDKKKPVRTALDHSDVALQLLEARAAEAVAERAKAAAELRAELAARAAEAKKKEESSE